MIDFKFNGEKLSDHLLMICSFSGSEDTTPIGNNISINKVKAPNSDKYMSVGYAYDDAFNLEFSICKNTCETDELIINPTELNTIVRWLNRKTHCIFKPIYDDNSFSEVFYRGTFNIELVNSDEGIIGLNLTFNTDAPYGYQDQKTYEHTFSSSTDTFIINDVSDEVGYLYAEATIILNESGNLRIKNSLDPDNEIYIENCKNGETIKLYGEQKIIEAPSSHNNIYNDFNYNFFRVNNTYDNKENVYTSNLKCKITVKYYPVRKVGIIL